MGFGAGRPPRRDRRRADGAAAAADARRRRRARPGLLPPPPPCSARAVSVLRRRRGRERPSTRPRRRLRRRRRRPLLLLRRLRERPPRRVFRRGRRRRGARARGAPHGPKGVHDREVFAPREREPATHRRAEPPRDGPRGVAGRRGGDRGVPRRAGRDGRALRLRRVARRGPRELLRALPRPREGGVHGQRSRGPARASSVRRVRPRFDRRPRLLVPRLGARARRRDGGGARTPRQNPRRRSAARPARRAPADRGGGAPRRDARGAEAGKRRREETRAFGKRRHWSPAPRRPRRSARPARRDGTRGNAEALLLAPRAPGVHRRVLARRAPDRVLLAVLAAGRPAPGDGRVPARQDERRRGGDGRRRRRDGRRLGRRGDPGAEGNGGEAKSRPAVHGGGARRAGRPEPRPPAPPLVVRAAADRASARRGVRHRRFRGLGALRLGRLPRRFLVGG